MSEIIDKDFCPCCHSEKISIWGTDLYECDECKVTFNSEDIEREKMHLQISAICSHHNATEDHMKLHVDISEPSQGLTEREKPQVLSIFQDPEGIIWVKVDFEYGPLDIDDFLTDSVREILEWLQDELQ